MSNFGDCQVLVCGGGCAGLGAAIAAARNGARTLLVERAGFAGGILTCVGLPHFDGLIEKSSGRIVVRGIALELFSKMGECAPDATHIRNNTHPRIRDIEKFKLLSDRLLAGEGDHLEVLYHSMACGVTVQGDRIVEVQLANKAGLVRVRPQVVIDCTGDADMAAWAGAPTEKNKELQPMTLHFRIGNVKYGPETRKKAAEAVERAHAAGDLPFYYGPGFGPFFASDEAYIHAVRVPADGTDPADFTRAEMQGRKDAWTMFSVWKKDVPGFEDSYYISSGPYIGVRETRRIVGQYVLTDADIAARKEFDDAIATGCWYLDQHPNKVTKGSANEGRTFQPDPYDIPYRSLVPQKVSNLLVAGRCHSATQMAASSTRVTATAMAMGEAAGTAAALAIMGRTSTAELAGVDIRKRLESQNAGPAKRS
jgi:hypothetical protein